MIFRQHIGIFLGCTGAYAEILSKYRVRRGNIKREKLAQSVRHVEVISWIFMKSQNVGAPEYVKIHWGAPLAAVKENGGQLRFFEIAVSAFYAFFKFICY